MSTATATHLRDALAEVFGRRVEVLDRAAHPYASSFPADVVLCDVEDVGELKVHCKYEAGLRYSRFGHRGGPGYEARVYRQVVRPLELSAPAYYGCWSAGGDGTWLFVEFADGSRRLSEGPSAAADLAGAAAWAGRFHRAASELAPPRFLKRYDTAYYTRWARRASDLAGPARHERYPWLAALCEGAEDALRALPERSGTIIHGEFTPHNVLARGRDIVPVDWETAAVAAGEIDVASLTEGWPDDVVAACETAYVAARWPAGEPAEFRETLDLARLYWSLRWLGDRAEWLEQPKMALRYERFRVVGERLGLI